MLRRTFHLALIGALGLVPPFLFSCRGPHFEACQSEYPCNEQGATCDDLVCCDGHWVVSDTDVAAACDPATTAGGGGEGGSGGSSTNTGGSGGTGGSVPCPEPETKLCGTTCVSIGDPAYGCGDFSSCEPCSLDHATAGCELGACVVAQCDANYDDCDGMDETGCEADLLNDLATCGSCQKSCANSSPACASGVCAGPCGPIPMTGLHVCWVYGGTVGASDHVGFAGGIADPSLGQTIQTQFLDPMGGCVNPNPGQPFVWCDLGTPPGDADIQFRAGLHAAQGTGTIAGTWDCSDTSCAGDVYVYFNGVEIGSLISNIAIGALTTITHFNPPGLKNAKVDPP